MGTHAFCNERDYQEYLYPVAEKYPHPWEHCETEVSLEFPEPGEVLNGTTNAVFFSQVEGTKYYPETISGVPYDIETTFEFQFTNDVKLSKTATFNSVGDPGHVSLWDPNDLSMEGFFRRGDNTFAVAIEDEELLQATITTRFLKDNSKEVFFVGAPAVFKFSSLCDQAPTAPECDYSKFRPLDVLFSDENVKIYPDFDPAVTEYKLDIQNVDRGFFKATLKFPTLTDSATRHPIEDQWVAKSILADGYTETINLSLPFHSDDNGARHTETLIAANDTLNFEMNVVTIADNVVADEVTYTFRLYDWIKPPWADDDRG